ncbi:MAG TPA: PspC domain-containing protein [Nakamurella sp.]|nr:PspC domain-containing protein [Nakamurella sp.]
MTYNTQQRPSPTGHRSFLPWRSRGDKKIAGVAGGLGRAFGIDPVLFRVAFVVLAIFGGAGVLLYALGWLLMPADGDEVSAIEALAGRGRSSVSTALTVVLIIVALSSVGSLFSWGIPFWPVVIAAVIVFALARHGRMNSCGRGRPVDWNQRANEFADRISSQAAAWGERAGQWGSQWSARRGSEHAGGWGGSRSAGPWGPQSSPFERPAFWDSDGPSPSRGPEAPDRVDEPAGGWAAPRAASGWAAPNPGSRATGPAAPDAPGAWAAQEDADTRAATAGRTEAGQEHPEAQATRAPSPEEMLARERRTPPAWDPLGVAPFAWDLPDPEPVAEQAPDRPAPRRSGLGRLFLGLALMAGGLAAGGVFAGWWTMSWAAVAAITLAVIGFGVLVTSLRGSGGRSLIGPGIFLSLVTLALTVTGISGTTGYGQQTWTVTDADQIQSSYLWNAGQATLDLSGLTVDKGETVATELTVNGGQATVIVPKGVTVEATCSTDVGDVTCLGVDRNGVRPQATGHQDGDADSGTLVIEVHGKAGQVEVISRG